MQYVYIYIYINCIINVYITHTILLLSSSGISSKKEKNYPPRNFTAGLKNIIYGFQCCKNVISLERNHHNFIKCLR